MQDYEYNPRQAALGNCFMYVMVYMISSILLWGMTFQLMYKFAVDSKNLDGIGSFIIFSGSMMFGFFVLGPATTFLFILYRNTRSEPKAKRKNDSALD